MQLGSEVFFDNLFTSFPLLEELSLRQTAGTGTVRQNRLNKIPIKSKKELEARAVPRGTMDDIGRGLQGGCGLGGLEGQQGSLHGLQPVQS